MAAQFVFLPATLARHVFSHAGLSKSSLAGAGLPHCASPEPADGDRR